MADEDAPQCKVVYIDGAEEEETNWIKRAGKARVTYPNGCTFEGTFDDEKTKQGAGVYVWMGPGAEEDSVEEKARYEGAYKDNMKHGVGNTQCSWDARFRDRKTRRARRMFAQEASSLQAAILSTAAPGSSTSWMRSASCSTAPGGRWLACP